MLFLYVKYAGHISVVTGKLKEVIEMKGETVYDLLRELDRKYPGFQDIFINPEDGILNLRTAISLQRSGECASQILDPKFKLKGGDNIMLW